MKRGSICISLAPGIIVGLLVLATASAAQTIKTFDVPNSTRTVPVSINLSGKITGYYFASNSDPNAEYLQSFLRQSNGVITTFGVQLDGYTWPTRANDINSSGEIVGTFAYAMGVDRGFLRKVDGRIITFSGSGDTSSSLRALTEPPPLTCNSIDGATATGMNAVGQITGSFGQGCLLGFLRQRDGTIVQFQVGEGWVLQQLTVPQSINLVGQIAGYYYEQDSVGGFLRQTDGTIVRFKVPGAVQTFAQSINLFGQIVGNSDGHGFLRRPNGTFITFDPLGSIGTQANAINVLGQITGFYATADGVYHGFLRQPTGRIVSFDVPGATGGTFPADINDLGQIVGSYQDANFVLHGFIRNP